MWRTDCSLVTDLLGRIEIRILIGEVTPVHIFHNFFNSIALDGTGSWIESEENII